MGRDQSWLVLPACGRLKKAVRKLKFFIRLNLRRLRLDSILGCTSNRVRRLSFNDRWGLLHGRCCIEVIDEDEKSDGNCSVIGVQRATPCFASDDDIDGRAEIFIANFRRHLRLERQVSLE
ncbi:hypothetical protein I3760_07G208800 [Carya illinoinensis]|nr:hypothetical protein I3760_07G208800 [Carya illinoinensis]KAG6649436.1 hypothetical protein CIPAW_07G212400 [Carya illinoinensis]